MTMTRVSISRVTLPGAPDLDALAGLERANHFAADDNFACFDFCADAGVGTDSENAIGNMNFSFELAIQDEIFPTRDFSFDLDALSHAGWRVRRNWRRSSGTPG